ncbi:hypothetical protein RB195_016615 [Necator americanus]|uniref:AMP-binding enzyme n=1 Tax=Necator americanus TaxID=51031 RepID=A0ABR1C1A0_NECAM
MTESGMASHLPPLDSRTNFTNVGKIASTFEQKIISTSTGEEVPTGERGEICVRGPTIMKGYLNRPEETAETIDADGWLHTGDIGYVDNKGQTYIVDRLKELIKVKGLQVAPAELEDILLSHKEIQDAAVIGVPDEKTGEKPRAYVVRANETLTEADVKHFIEAQPARGLIATPQSMVRNRPSANEILHLSRVDKSVPDLYPKALARQIGLPAWIIVEDVDVFDSETSILEMVLFSTYAKVPVCNTPLHEKVLTAILQHMDRNPNRIAFISAEDPAVRITFKEIYNQAYTVASFLSSRGYGHLDVCCQVMPNCIEYTVFYLGALLCGGAMSGASAMFTDLTARVIDELERQFVDSHCKVVITDEAHLDKVLLATKRCRDVETIICVQCPESTRTLPKSVVPWQNVTKTPVIAIPKYNFSPDDMALLPYSSGTTGSPKGVVLTHKNFTTMVDLVNSHFDEKIVHKLGDSNWDYHNENLLLMLPFYHIYGFGLLNQTLLKGTTGIIFAKFEPTVFLNAIQTYKPKMLMLVPPILLLLTKHPVTSNYNLTSFQFVLTGAAPAGKDLCDEFLNKYKHIISIGTGDEVATGQRGEICVRGPTIMKGYLNRPEATAETIDADGWLHTGDIGYVDSKGQTYIVDRLKELIKVKGLQVAPAELEDILLSHKEIQDAAVIGVPDEKTGEKPRAYVVRANETLTEADVKHFIEEKVSSYKFLTGGVVFVDEIPKSPSGKILRRFLRDQAAVELKSKI